MYKHLKLEIIDKKLKEEKNAKLIEEKKGKLEESENTLKNYKSIERFVIIVTFLNLFYIIMNITSIGFLSVLFSVSVCISLFVLGSVTSDHENKILKLKNELFINNNDEKDYLKSDFFLKIFKDTIVSKQDFDCLLNNKYGIKENLCDEEIKTLLMTTELKDENIQWLSLYNIVKFIDQASLLVANKNSRTNDEISAMLNKEELNDLDK